MKVTREDTDTIFAALAHETRRDLLVLLSRLGDELPSGYLAGRFPHSWPTITRHLSVLERAGLVEVRREGRGAFYRLRRERALAVVAHWIGHLEPATPDATWTSSGPKDTDRLRHERKKKS